MIRRNVAHPHHFIDHVLANFEKSWRPLRQNDNKDTAKIAKGKQLPHYPKDDVINEM
jgi:hypothetical protein